MKPANILVTPEGSPKLADFNISFSGNVTGATPAAYFGGSLAYMSPEQLEAVQTERTTRAQELDRRSDLYSLGIVLWELLTGFRPFRDESVEGDWSATLDRWASGDAGADRYGRADASARLPGGLAVALGDNAGLRTATGRWASGLEMARRLELCTNPKASSLLFPSSASWRSAG